jgi:hypothetical protein
LKKSIEKKRPALHRTHKKAGAYTPAFKVTITFLRLTCGGGFLDIEEQTLKHSLFYVII